ncbi:hypothetical protein HPP92_012344 [Vanilla planifolia]|uniref:Uncharacterized protein n=1 Tax=Vanilla planifolia TaxID=51239 RepID=A0A835UYY5_VANPL|nr:hypothetical protein HPP92_012344 [Vanilla planifolia]
MPSERALYNDMSRCGGRRGNRKKMHEMDEWGLLFKKRFRGTVEIDKVMAMVINGPWELGFDPFYPVFLGIHGIDMLVVKEKGYRWDLVKKTQHQLDPNPFVIRANTQTPESSRLFTPHPGLCSSTGFMFLLQQFCIFSIVAAIVGSQELSDASQIVSCLSDFVYWT